MSGWAVARAISGLLCLFGGLFLLLSWGLSFSLWSIIGLILGLFCIFGGTLVMREQYVRGGTMAGVAAVISWGMFPWALASNLILISIIMMLVGGIMGLALELAAD